MDSFQLFRVGCGLAMMRVTLVLGFLGLISVVKCLRPVENICLRPGGRRIYVNLGESGILSGFNLTTGNVKDGFENLTPQQCNVEIVTCPSCVIRIAFRHLNLSHQCGNGGNYPSIDNPCRCDYVRLSEPQAENHAWRPICGQIQENNHQSSSLIYESKTRTLNIALIYSEAHHHAFTLSFTARRNRQIIEGSLKTNWTGSISSPFFPSPYPRDLASDYLLNCVDGSDCRIRLIFTDFQLGAVSFLEFFDGQNRRLDVATGLSFRPPIIISSGSTLLLRFYANGGSGVGFKAIYTFISESQIDNSVKINTDCGGFVEDFGGAITMMNMAVENVQNYDCVWLIRPPENFLHLKTHLFLKISTFLDFAGNTELQVRQGLTSDKQILETLVHPISQINQQRPKEHIVPVATGFYVRLKGTFTAASRLAITYAAFSYNNWDTVYTDRNWYTHTPNYFFPKTERFANLKTATLVFLFSSIGLIFLISALIILLYRMNSRARQQRELQSHLQTISELLADNARIEEIIPDDPPDYEPPPEYQDVMKAPPSSTSRRKRRVSRHSTRRSRSSPGERRRGQNVPILEVTLPPENHLHAPETHRRSHSNSSLMTIGYRGSPIPDSPPPPYSPNIPQFRFENTDIMVTEPVAVETIGELPTTWRVTAVTTSNQSKPHRRSQSCGGTPSEPFASQRRLTQSNPLTPYESPTLERVAIPSSPTTDCDVCLFSSLESADYIPPKDCFDWEEFDKQFPRKKEMDNNCGNVRNLMKKYNVQQNVECFCEGACGCASSSTDVYDS